MQNTQQRKGNIMLTVTQCAATLGISAARVLHLIKAGALTATRYGRMWLVEEAEFERFAALNRPRGVPRVKQTNKGE
jgi:excisionase family DNA binding protein